MNEFILYLKKDFWSILNIVKGILKNPKRLIPYVLILGYFGFIFFVRRKSNTSSEELEDALEAAKSLNDTFEIAKIITGLVLILFLFINLFASLNKNITFFKMGDVNLAFTAPLRPRLIMTYALVKSLIPGFFTGMIILIYSTPFLLEKEEFSLMLSGIGLALFALQLSTLRFLGYIASIKFGRKNLLKFIYGALAFIFVGTIALATPNFNPWEGTRILMNSNIWAFVPVVGGTISYIFPFSFGEDVAQFAQILHLLLVLAGCGLLLFLSEDYYEEVMASTQQLTDLKNMQQTGEKNQKHQFALFKNRKVGYTPSGMGAKALFWRNWVSDYRSNYFPLFGFDTILFGIGGLLAGILISKGIMEPKVFYAISMGLAFLYFIFGVGKNESGDLSRHYFFLLPAEDKKKIWNILKLPSYQTLASFGILNLLTFLIGGLDLLLIPLYLLFQISVFWLGLFSGLVVKILIPESLDRKFVVPVMMLAEMIFVLAPIMLIGIATHEYFENHRLTMATMAGLTIIANGIILLFNENILKRLELK